MPDRTGVEWCTTTLNLIPGCSDALLPDGTVSPACAGCFAKRIAARLADNPKTPQYKGLAVFRDGKPEWTGALGYNPDELEKPRRWTRGRRIFLESMGDIAHEAVTPERFAELWALLAENPARKEPHTFYLLTKRPAHLRELLSAMRHDYCTSEETYWRAMQWVVAMTTTENQKCANYRVPELLRCPALHFGVSAEPLVGPLTVRPWLPARDDRARAAFARQTGLVDETGPRHLGWVIAGGWSGPSATPTHSAWFRRLRAEAAAAQVPFFFKQWGDFVPLGQFVAAKGQSFDVRDFVAVQPGAAQRRGRPGPEFHLRLGKRAAGRLLDGVEHSGIPLVGCGP